MSTLLDVNDLTVALVADGVERPIVRDVSFALAPGECLGIVGESGSGKSLTARALIRLLRPGLVQSGDLRLGDSSIDDLSRAELKALRGSKVSMIFQDPRSHIDPLWRIEDYLAEGIRESQGVSRREARERCLELVRAVGIADPEHCMRLYPHELSGGMLQRIMIAGALSSDPDLLIADEPTTALDVTTQAEIMAILADLRRERHLTVVFITHDLELASSICDRVMVMYAGRVVEEGGCAQVFEHPMHPYSWGLIRARPAIEGERAELLRVIPGEPVNPIDAPPGCPFAPRCEWVEDPCREAPLPLRELSGGRRSACKRIEEIADALV